MIMLIFAVIAVPTWVDRDAPASSRPRSTRASWHAHARSSSPVQALLICVRDARRSTRSGTSRSSTGPTRTGLRPARRYRAAARLDFSPTPLPGWRNGRRRGLKILRPQGRVGSNPTPGTAAAPRLRDPDWVRRS